MTVKQAIPPEFCLRCKGCCRFSQQESIWSPHLLAEEKEKIGEILIVANPGEDNFVCHFLKCNDNKCRIYSRRPFECQIYPFLFDRKKEKLYLAVDPNCAYVKENRTSSQFESYVRSLSELIRTPEYKEIFRRNPQLFQDYSGVCDLAEIEI